MYKLYVDKVCREYLVGVTSHLLHIKWCRGFFSLLEDYKMAFTQSFYLRFFSKYLHMEIYLPNFIKLQ